MGTLFSASASVDQPHTISITALERAIEKSKQTSLKIPAKVTKKQFVDLVAAKSSYKKRDNEREARQLEKICETYTGDDEGSVDLNELLVGLAFFSHGRDATDDGVTEERSRFAIGTPVAATC